MNTSTEVISLYAKGEKIYPRAVTGRYARLRWACVWITQLVFYGLPWLTWNDRPAVLFDLAARRFYIFGLVLHPQDFIYLTALLLICAYSLFLFTAIAGRVWCGYACPQTVYTEIFMWIERLFEGDRIKRMRLDQGPWTFERAWRKGGKHAVWIVVALFTGFSFVGYFTPIRQLWAESFTLSFGPWEWFWVLFYGFATWGNAGFMREQVCKYMCPYARFQSAMFDRDSLIIGYDIKRGDPRGSRSRKADPKTLGLGDCIDCGLCVQVCPTGIDIRKGLQYECIGCAACADVCDGVMDKMGYAPGLVRYATQQGLDERWPARRMLGRVLRPRVLVYGTILLVLVGAFAASLALRAPFRADVVRDRASLARLVEDGRIENTYRVQLMNTTETAQRYQVQAGGLPGLQVVARDAIEVGSTQSRWLPLAVQIGPDEARAAGPGVHPIVLRIERLAGEGGETVVLEEKSTFVIPR